MHHLPCFPHGSILQNYCTTSPSSWTLLTVEFCLLIFMIPFFIALRFPRPLVYILLQILTSLVLWTINPSVVSTYSYLWQFVSFQFCNLGLVLILGWQTELKLRMFSFLQRGCVFAFSEVQQLLLTQDHFRDQGLIWEPQFQCLALTLLCTSP